jgi:Zn-dependent M28 family amino/carboxypeptidase
MLNYYLSDDFKTKIRIKKYSKDVLHFLAVDIGERTLRKYENLEKTRRFIKREFTKHGGSPQEQIYMVNGKEVANIITEIPGTETPEEIIVVGAHYDTVEDTPGADDNATSIAALLEFHWLMQKTPMKKTLRFVAFTLEEPPFFSTEEMGSMKYARECKKNNDDIKFMLCLEMLGYGSRNHKQDYPLPAMNRSYPKAGNFLAVFSLPSSARYVYLWQRLFNEVSRFKLFEVIAPASVPGMDHSDHASFIKNGYPAIMIADTGFYRNKNYHTDGDTYETINFKFLTRNIFYSYQVIVAMGNMDVVIEEN